MTQVSSDAIAVALTEYFQERHRELVKQTEGVGDDGVNWHPGADMNSIWELVGHALGAERGMIVAITRASVTFERQPNTPGTEALALARIEQANADLITYLGQTSAIDPAGEVQFYRRPMSIALAMSHGAGHLNEHLGHIALTRQLWEQYGKRGALAGAEPSERYRVG